MISRISGLNSVLVRIQSKNINNKQQYDYNTSSSNESFSGNVVSFGSTAYWLPDYTKRLRKAFKVQVELRESYYNKSLDNKNIQKILNKYSSVPIEVKPLEELPKVIDRKNRQVFLAPQYQNSMKLTGAVFYINDKFSNISEASKLISDCVYGFSKMLQRYDNGDYLAVGKFTSNPNEAKFLAHISRYGADDIEKMLFNSLENNNKYRGLSTRRDIEPQNIVKLLPSGIELSKMIDESLDRNFNVVFDKYKIPEEYSGEYNFFYNKSKPYLRKSVKQQFEMESEALLTEIETKEYGLVPYNNRIFSDIKTKNVYSALISILK